MEQTVSIDAPEAPDKAKAQQRNVALYPQDIADVEVIRGHYKLDSFSRAVRRAINETVEPIREGTQAA